MQADALKSFLYRASNDELNQIAMMVMAESKSRPEPLQAVKTVEVEVDVDPEIVRMYRSRVKELERTLKDCLHDMENKTFSYKHKIEHINTISKVLNK